MDEYIEETTSVTGEGTGDARVDAVRARLAALDTLEGPDAVDLAGQLTCSPTCRPLSPRSSTATTSRRRRPRPDALMPRRQRLDAELVRRGLARSRDHAAQLIAAGRVTVAGLTATKAATGVTTDSALVVIDDSGGPDYASRGGHKLAGALEAFMPLGWSSPGGWRSTPARRPAGSPTCCCGTGSRRWPRSTSATASWLGSCSRTRGSRSWTAPTCATCCPRLRGAAAGAGGGGPVVHLARRWCCPRWSASPAPDADLVADGQAAVRGRPSQARARAASSATRGDARRCRRRRRRAAAELGLGVCGVLRQPAARSGGERRVLPLAAGGAAPAADVGRDPIGSFLRVRSERVVRVTSDTDDACPYRLGRLRRPASAGGERSVLVVTHTGRPAGVDVAREITKRLAEAGIRVRMLGRRGARPSGVEPADVVIAGDDPAAGCEIAVAVGGDGTILRAADITRPSGTPVLGINLGHVGFLAEAESDDLDDDGQRGRRQLVRRRGAAHASTWPSFWDGDVAEPRLGAERGQRREGARERMLEVVVEIDGRPLSRWGCDGVVFATPTGSTAYAFSAGGPVVWPQVDALLLVPLSAHALFARPLVTAPTSRLAVEVLRRDRGRRRAVVRRPSNPRPARRAPVSRSTEERAPVRLARLHLAPFTDRLVAKFDLPVGGWRGAAERRRRPAGHGDSGAMLEELRISSLGVIDEARAGVRARAQRRHRRDRCRQDDGGDGARPVAGCACGPGRRAPGRAARPRRGRARRRRRPRRRRPERRRPAPSSTRACCIVGRTVSAEGRSRATAGGAAVPAGVLGSLTGERVVIHGQSDQQRLLLAGPPARVPGRVRRWPRWPMRWRPTGRRTSGSSRSATRLHEVVSQARRARPGGRPAAVRPDRDRGRGPEPGEDAPWSRRSTGWRTPTALRTCRRGRPLRPSPGTSRAMDGD